MKRVVVTFLVVMLLLGVSVQAEKLTVWTWYGTSPSGVAIRDLLTNEFTNETGIEVEVLTVPIENMVNKLLLSFIGGEAPDIVELYSNQVVDLGIRGALYNLNQFADIKDVLNEINPLLLPQVAYKSALYALPGEVNWSWTYYRKDILQEIGLDVPSTWEELISLSSKLKARNKDVYYQFHGDPTAIVVGRYLPFVFQRKSDIYSPDGTRSTLDEAVCIEAFDYFTDLYTEHSFPIEDPLYTTFYNGDTPVQVLQNWFFGWFETGAPQINGLWDIAPFPGTKQPDGSINNTSTGKMLTWSILESSKNKDAAWKLMKFMASSRFAEEMMNRSYNSSEKIRLFFANKNSFEKAYFTPKQIALAKYSLANCRMQTSVVGGLIANRYIDFAFNKVVLQGADSVESIKAAAGESTLEIEKKLKEFSRYIATL